MLIINEIKDMNHEGSTCICRVPKPNLKEGQIFECVHCGECTYTLNIKC